MSRKSFTPPRLRSLESENTLVTRYQNEPAYEMLYNVLRSELAIYHKGNDAPPFRTFLRGMVRADANEYISISDMKLETRGRTIFYGMVDALKEKKEMEKETPPIEKPAAPAPTTSGGDMIANTLVSHLGLAQALSFTSKAGLYSDGVNRFKQDPDVARAFSQRLQANARPAAKPIDPESIRTQPKRGPEKA